MEGKEGENVKREKVSEYELLRVHVRACEKEREGGKGERERERERKSTFRRLCSIGRNLNIIL